MIQPNPEFAARLLGARRIEDEAKGLEEEIHSVSFNMGRDTIELQGRGRYKDYATVAAMLSASSTLRTKMFQTNRADLEVYDRLVADARQVWFQMQQQKPQGMKIANAIVRVSPL